MCEMNEGQVPAVHRLLETFGLFFFALAESGTSNNERSLEEIPASFLHLLLVSKSFVKAFSLSFKIWA